MCCLCLLLETELELIKSKMKKKKHQWPRVQLEYKPIEVKGHICEILYPQLAVHGLDIESVEKYVCSY